MLNALYQRSTASSTSLLRTCNHGTCVQAHGRHLLCAAVVNSLLDFGHNESYSRTPTQALLPLSYSLCWIQHAAPQAGAGTAPSVTKLSFVGSMLEHDLCP